MSSWPTPNVLLDVLSQNRIEHNLRVVGSNFWGQNFHLCYSSGLLHLWLSLYFSFDNNCEKFKILMRTQIFPRGLLCVMGWKICGTSRCEAHYSHIQTLNFFATFWDVLVRGPFKKMFSVKLGNLHQEIFLFYSFSNGTVLL